MVPGEVQVEEGLGLGDLPAVVSLAAHDNFERPKADPEHFRGSVSTLNAIADATLRRTRSKACLINISDVVLPKARAASDLGDGEKIPSADKSPSICLGVAILEGI